MLIRIIGAALIIFSCAGIGFRMASQHRKEEHSLECLCFLLDFMQCELQYRRTPLPELCKKTAVQAVGSLREVFYLLSAELDNQVLPDVESCMDVVLSKTRSVPSRCIVCLQQLGKTLGRFDVEGQVVGLESSRQYCRRMLKQLRHNKDGRLRSYKTLGLCAGAALVVLFL